MYNLHKNVYLFLKIVVAIRFLFIICDIQRDESEDNQALVSYLTISSEQTRTTDIEIHTNKNNYAISLSLSLSLSLSHYIAGDITKYLATTEHYRFTTEIFSGRRI